MVWLITVTLVVPAATLRRISFHLIYCVSTTAPGIGKFFSSHHHSACLVVTIVPHLLFLERAQRHRLEPGTQRVDFATRSARPGQRGPGAPLGQVVDLKQRLQMI